MKKSIIFGVFTFVIFLMLGVSTPVSAKNKYNANIPDDALSYNGHYYYFYEGSVAWEDAKAACEALGGHLVTFSNADEEDAVWQYIKEKGSPAWIGLYNAGFYEKIYKTIDDEWHWVTGEKIKYTGWHETQPDHESHFIQDTYDKYGVIGTAGEVSTGHLDNGDTPSWGDFDEEYCVPSVKGYICEWDIYEIKVDTKKVSVKKGKKVTISYTIYDKFGHTKVKSAKAYLKTGDKKIAKVLKSGNIKAVAVGTTTITLKYKGATAKVKVTVTAKSSKK